MPDPATAARTDRTAVIDVGSNSVRLVIFGDNERAPLALLNEKAFCGLGRGVSDTGRLNPEGVEHAIRTLRRFSWVAKSSGATRTIAFATAAVRDSVDGGVFVQRVQQETGIGLRILSGEEEAHLAGMGILFGIPGARGIVGDMGGSSLELAEIGGGNVGRGVSLPLGPLQFPGGTDDPGSVKKAVQTQFGKLDWLAGDKGQTLYLVGGTWRAFAKLDIGIRNYGLNIIHGYEMAPARANDLAELIANQSPTSLSGDHGVSKRRLSVLPTASMVLQRMIRLLEPDKLVFSAHGVREGAYFEGLPETTRGHDPLLAGVESIARHEARFSARTGRQIHDWVAPLFAEEDSRLARLRLAACTLCDAGWRTHPDYRATQSYRRVLRAPLLGLDHAERTYVAVAILRRYSHKAGEDVVREARTMLSEKELLSAERTGAAIRLALTLTGGAASLGSFRIRMSDQELALGIPAEQQHLASEAVHARLRHLAKLFFATARIEDASLVARHT